MKVLITGATGFIGSHLAEALHEKGYLIRCLVRPSTNTDPIKHLPFEPVYGDFFDFESLRKAVEGVDGIYHVAGVTKAKTKQEYFRGNHTATRNLLDAVVTAQPNIRRFIHISSQTVTGPSRDSKPVDETTPLHPITTYGISKMEAEKECRTVMEKIPVTIVRPPTVYGPRDKDVFEFFNTMNKGLQPVVGFNHKRVSMIHVHDLVRGIILAGEHPSAVGNTYFVSSERFYTWKEVGEITARALQKRALRIPIPEFGVYVIAAFAELFAAFSRKPALINFEKAKDMVQDAWICSSEKAQTDLGFREHYSLEEGIQMTVRWYQQQGWL